MSTLTPPLFLAVASLASQSAAMVIRHDRADAAYLEAGRPFRAVCRVGKAGDATLVTPRWALTAAHVVAGMRRESPAVKLVCEGSEHAIARIVLHPDWRDLGPHDLALIALGTDAAGIEPIPVFWGEDEKGATATLVGHGATRSGRGGTWSEDGKRRAVTSVLDDLDERWMYFSFDAPPGGTDLEGAPGRGDSGGPALVHVSGRPFVAGVSSLASDGLAGPGTYGARDHFVRLSRYRAWLFEVAGLSGSRR